MTDFLNSWEFNYIGIPILITLAKIIDVSLGTLRIILVSKGARKLAPVLGFIEVLIWIIAIGQVMKNLTNPINYIAYAFGFALGNYVGILIEQKLALGNVIIRIITRHDATELINYLQSNDIGVTVIPAEGTFGPVHLIFSVLKRSKIIQVIDIIKKFNPKAFYSIEDVRYVSGSFGALETHKRNYWKSFLIKKK
ncbi:MAG: DUF2179 domain-containing protein [Bacteroidota bacterium]